MWAEPWPSQHSSPCLYILLEFWIQCSVWGQMQSSLGSRVESSKDLTVIRSHCFSPAPSGKGSYFSLYLNVSLLYQWFWPVNEESNPSCFCRGHRSPDFIVQPMVGQPAQPREQTRPCVTKGKDNRTLPVSPECGMLCPVGSVHKIWRRWLGRRSLEWEGEKKMQICIFNQFCFRLGIKLWCLCGFQFRFLSMGTKIKVELKPFSFIHTCGVLKF